MPAMMTNLFGEILITQKMIVPVDIECKNVTINTLHGILLMENAFVSSKAALLTRTGTLINALVSV